MARWINCVVVLIVIGGCMTVKFGALDGEHYDVSRSYATQFDPAWEATIDAMQRYPITTIEKASGILITDWMDGTSDVYYIENAGQRQMLQDRVRFNIKVSPSSDGTKVTVNQYVKLYAPLQNPTDPLGMQPPVFTWQDASGIKDLPTKTASKREKEILDAIGARLSAASNK